jgi:hypothetical protein
MANLRAIIEEAGNLSRRKTLQVRVRSWQMVCRADGIRIAIVERPVMQLPFKGVLGIDVGLAIS